MARDGLNVPPGFTITTGVCEEFYKSGTCPLNCRPGSVWASLASPRQHAPAFDPSQSKGMPSTTWMEMIKAFSVHHFSPPLMRAHTHTQAPSCQLA